MCADVRIARTVEAAVRGAAVVFNLAGILFERGEQQFDAVHAQGAGSIARAAARRGARLVHVSALGADVDSRAAYARSKAQGEALVFAEAPEATVFRPSIVFGPEDEFINRFAAMARISPVLPLIGGGETRFQPAFVGDVVEAVVRAASGDAKPGGLMSSANPTSRRSGN